MKKINDRQFTKIPLVTLLSVFVAAFSSCNNVGKEEANDQNTQEEASSKADKNGEMHKKHKSLQNNFAHQDIIVLEDPYKPSEVSAKKLQEVIGAYITLKNAFFNGNKKTIDQAGNSMLKQVTSITSGTDNQEAQEALQQHKRLLEDKLKEMRHIRELKEKRSYLSHISEIVYCTIKSFDLDNKQALFAAYCPMAFDNKGAYWITESQTIRNPYFGNKMPDCGSIEEKL
jgi:hypothetical protein